MHNFSKVFQNILYDINQYGEESQPRDLKVIEKMLSQTSINPTKVIANFEKRKFNWKYFAGELAWYLKQDNNVDYISNFSGFWNNITNPGTNEINSNYGTLIFGEQLKWVVDSLKSDQNTRQAIAFLNQPKFQFEGNKDFVCTMYMNFFIRDNKLNMKVQMRSNDVFYGLTFDAPFFGFVLQHVRLWLLEEYPDLELGTYFHCADNIHYYERHFDLANSIMENELQKEQYKMDIEHPLFYIDEESQMCLTNHGARFINEVNDTVEYLKSAGNSKDPVYYYNILVKYLNITRI